MSATKLFRVDGEQTRQTLAAALRAWLPQLSWEQARRVVAARRVTVNGNLCLDPSRRLKVDEVVKVHAESLPKPPDEEDIIVPYHDRHLLIVEKPAGITSVRHFEERDMPPRRRQLQPTLEDLLPRVMARLGARGMKGNPPRVRPVHRLDRDTSGLMVFARSVEAEEELCRMFKKHELLRRYLAVTLGRPEARTIESYLAENRGDGRRGSTRNPELGKLAITHVRPIEFMGDYTLVECRLETGRTHQIRIHLSEAGHPVCGDKQYNKPLGSPLLIDRSGAPRLALHAAELAFAHPVTRAELGFRMPLPSELALFVERLRAAAKIANPSE